MSEQLNVSLLGRIQVDVGGESIDVPGQKPLALLAYLATTGRPHSRETLSDLLWGDSTESRAKASLRTALWHLGQSLEPFLVVNRQTVAIDPTAPHWVDVVEFRNTIEELGSRSAEVDSNPEFPLDESQALALTRAVSYYRGDFLAGFEVHHAPAFDDWVMRRREWARHLAVQALYQLVDYYTAQRAYQMGIDAVTRLLMLAPWQEEAHRQRMLLLALRGQRNAALAQYETCRSILAEELDVEPTVETQRLQQRIKAGRPLIQEEPNHAILSVHATSPSLDVRLNASDFVGRESETTELKRALTDPTTRLVTLVGPAGIGKTHLSLTVASQIAKLFEHGIGFVQLPSVEDTHTPAIDSDLCLLMARVLGLTFSGSLPRPTQILDYLRHKNLLLILDDFAYTPSRIQLVRNIIRYSRDVILLVIAPQPLNIESEQVIALGGLNCPNPSAGTSAIEAEPEDSLAYDCVSMFVSQARSVSPDFELTARNLRDVIQLCQWMGGLPLGIKVLAPWIEQYPLVEITRGIESRFGAQRRPIESVGDYEKVVERLLGYVWTLLSTAQQQSLSQLTCFNGSFSREAAVKITGVSPATLRSLLSKGLLESVGPDRYAWHPLLRRLVRDIERRSRQHLATTDCDLPGTAGAYRTYFLSLLTERETALQREDAKTAVHELLIDWSHIRRAWYSGARDHKTALLSRSVKGLVRFLHLQNWLWEGATLIDDAVQHLSCESEPSQRPADMHLIAHLSVEHARFLNAQMHYNQAREKAQAALQLASAEAEGSGSRGNGADLKASGHLEYGKALVAERAFEAAREHFTEALTLAGDHNLPAIQAETLTCLGVLQLESVSFSEAQYTLNEALELYQNLNDHRGMSKALNNLSISAMNQRRYAEARRHAKEALNAAQTLGDRCEESDALKNLGRVASEQGRYAAAAVNYERALTLAREAGDLRRECETLTELALLHLQDSEPEAAWKRGLLAVELAQILTLPALEGRAWLAVGHAFTEFKLFDQAVRAYKSALTLLSTGSHQTLAQESLAGMARVSFAQGDLFQARVLVEHILEHLAKEPPLTDSQHLRICLTCYQVLDASGDLRAADLLEQASRIYGTATGSAFESYL